MCAVAVSNGLRESFLCRLGVRRKRDQDFVEGRERGEVGYRTLIFPNLCVRGSKSIAGLASVAAMLRDL